MSNGIAEMRLHLFTSLIIPN